jgi:hypothetical protein
VILVDAEILPEFFDEERPSFFRKEVRRARTTFSDVPRYADIDFADQLALISAARMVHGFPDGTYRPEGLVSRYELADTLHRVCNRIEFLTDYRFPRRRSLPGLKDVAKPHVPTIRDLTDLGILDVPNGLFAGTRLASRRDAHTAFDRLLAAYNVLRTKNPNGRVVSYGELAQVLYDWLVKEARVPLASPEGASRFPDVPTDDPRYTAVASLTQAGILIGPSGEAFSGRRACTRAEFVLILKRMQAYVLRNQDLVTAAEALSVSPVVLSETGRFSGNRALTLLEVRQGLRRVLTIVQRSRTKQDTLAK